MLEVVCPATCKMLFDFLKSDPNGTSDADPLGLTGCTCYHSALKPGNQWQARVEWYTSSRYEAVSRDKSALQTSMTRWTAGTQSWCNDATARTAQAAPTEATTSTAHTHQPNRRPPEPNAQPVRHEHTSEQASSALPPVLARAGKRGTK